MGLALAAALAQAGAEVTLAARSGEEIEAAAIAIQKAGGAATTAVLDVTDLAAVHSFFAERPAFHILVNNAGTNRPMTMQQVSEADYDAVLDLNHKEAFSLTQQVVRALIDEEIAGTLIHIGPQMRHVVGPNRPLDSGATFAI